MPQQAHVWNMVKLHARKFSVKETNMKIRNVEDKKIFIVALAKFDKS